MKKLFLLFAMAVCLSSCEYLSPVTSKAMDEAEQTELMKKHNELVEKQNVILERIAIRLEKKQ